MPHVVIRAAQVLTAAAALFTVLWACGHPPTRPTERDLAGTWEGTIQPPPEPALSARLVIASDGGELLPTLTIGQTTYEPNRSPASVRTGVNVILNVRNGQTQVSFIGEVSPDDRHLTGQVAGLGPGTRFFAFDRR